MDIGIEVEYINALTRDGVAVEVGRGGKGEGLRLLDALLPVLLLRFLALLGSDVKKRLK